jgi:preprotein translocase subunit SecG
MNFGKFVRLRPFSIERLFMVRGFILAVHILLALMIIALVLLQRGKGAEAGAGFGSGASGTVFGARGTSTLFSKLTGVFAALFFATSLLLAYLGTHTTAEPTTVLERAAAATAATPATAVTPAAPTAAAPAPAAPQASTPSPAPSSTPAPAPAPEKK